MSKKKRTHFEEGPRRHVNGGKLDTELIALFEKHRGDLFKTNEISKMIGIKSTDPKYQELRDALRLLESNGKIVRGSRRRYGLPPPEQSVIEGVLKMQTTGNGIVVPDEQFSVGDTVLIRSRNLHAALQGDRVRVVLLAARKNERPQGEVLEVIERAFAPVVGKVERTKNSFVVRPETGKFTRDIVISRRELGGAKEGDKVKVQLYEWADEFRDPEGKVLEVLGTSGSVKAEMEAIAAEYDLPSAFPTAVTKEAEDLSNTIPAAELKKRLDLREETIFTIDPEDAKDFDDAVSLTTNADGTLRLGVHIADVSHYVTEDSALDQEAFARGTSVYLVGGVIPMLPERISNELCSLRPDEDKLTFSVFMTIDPETGEVTKSEFKRTVIRSAMRFSYEEAEKRITSGKGKHAPLLHEMRALSEKMYALRHSEGSIDFETDEVRFKFDAEGNPVESYKKERLGSMRMIEDFMLAANRSVAEYIGKKSKQGAERPFLYRIHADPDPAKVRELAALAKALGYKLQSENPRPKTIQKFLDSIKGKPEEKLLNQLMLRSMAKAIYAEHNVGHFGLAFLHYTHFTSPIRRYPDLIVHRMLAEYLKRGGMTSEREHHYFKVLPSIADQTSGLERRATEAERESIKVAQMLLMKEHLGEEFDGVISGVTHFGIFVQLPNGAEGLLHIRELEGFYTFDEAHYALTRQRSGRDHQRKSKKSSGAGERYRIGDPIRVQLVRIRQERRELDFRLAEF
jgi:ribonuclease R